MRNKNFSSQVILAMGLFFAIFVTIMIVTFWVMGSVPDVLIQCVLGAGGIEAVSLAFIKWSKVRSGENIGDSGEYVESDVIDE